MTTVYLLGAGFSRSLGAAMPLTKGLSDALVARAREAAAGRDLPGAESFAGDFEAWLTYLHANQPWLTESENLYNRSTFHLLVDQIAHVIDQCQNELFSAPMPVHLRSLTARWIEEQATVITFNYDDLVESAAMDVLRSHSTPEHTRTVYPVALPSAASRAPAGMSFGDGGSWPAFELLKLHGSTNWFYSGTGSPHGDVVYRASGEQHWNVRTVHRDSRDLADKVPFIVPPTAVKNEFYANDLLAAQWRMAARALSQADQLHVLGYSAPASDLLVRALIGTSFAGHVVTWVNPEPEAGRLLTFAARKPAADLHQYTSVEDYVRSRGPIWWSCRRDVPLDDTDHDGRAWVTPDVEEQNLADLRSGRCPMCGIEASGGQYDRPPDELTCPCCSSTWTRAEPETFKPSQTKSSSQRDART